MLSFFSQPDRIEHVWSFPNLNNFDASLAPYGDIGLGAPAASRRR